MAATGIIEYLPVRDTELQYISHRVLRWTLTPVVLFALLPLNLLLACTGHTLYTVILALQLAFYLMGYLGYKMEQRNLRNKLLFIPYYFLFMNINVIRGYSYLAKHKGTGAWEKAKRGADKKIKNRWINSRYMSTLINTFALLILFEYQEN